MCFPGGDARWAVPAGDEENCCAGRMRGSGTEEMVVRVSSCALLGPCPLDLLAPPPLSPQTRNVAVEKSM